MASLTAARERGCDISTQRILRKERHSAYSFRKEGQTMLNAEIAIHDASFLARWSTAA